MSDPSKVMTWLHVIILAASAIGAIVAIFSHRHIKKILIEFNGKSKDENPKGDGGK